MRTWLRTSSLPLVVLVLAVPLSGILTPPSYDGLPTTPVSTLALLPLTKFAMFVVAAIGLGVAAIPGLLLDDLDHARAGARWAYGFSVASMCVLLLTLSDILAVSLWEITDLDFVISFITQIDEGRYLMLQVLLGIVAGWVFQQSRTRAELTFAIITLSIAGVLPAFTGHSAANIEHWVVSSIMIVHLASMLIWVGGVIGILSLGAPRDALARFNRLALFAYVTIVVSGVGSTVSRVASWTDFWSDRYAIVLGAKILIVLAIGVLGYRLRAAIADDNGRIHRIIGIEASLLLTVVALAVTLERMANP